MTDERDDAGIQQEPGRAAGGVLGGLVLVFSVWPWVLYLRSAWAGFDPHDEVTELQWVKLFLGIWIFMWLAGLAIVLLSIGERFLRSMLQLVGRSDRCHGGGVVHRLLRGPELAGAAFSCWWETCAGSGSVPRDSGVGLDGVQERSDCFDVLMTSFLEDGKGGLPGIAGVVEFIASPVCLAEGCETRGLTHPLAEAATVLHCAMEVLNRVLGVAREEMCDSEGVQRVTGREAVAAAGAE